MLKMNFKCNLTYKTNLCEIYTYIYFILILFLISVWFSKEVIKWCVKIEVRKSVTWCGIKEERLNNKRRILVTQYENWREINVLVCLIFSDFPYLLTFEIIQKVDNILVVRDYILYFLFRLLFIKLLSK